MKTLLIALALAAPLFVFSQGQPPAATPPPVAVPASAPQYKIVRDGSVEGLESKVNDLMAAGWQPTGGVDFQAGVSQAMMRGVVQRTTTVERGRVVMPPGGR